MPTKLFKKGDIGNPNGRPKGCKNKATLFRAMVEAKEPELIQKAMDLALAGNEAMLKLLLERLLPGKVRDDMTPLAPAALEGYSTTGINGRVMILNKSLEERKITQRQHKSLMDILKIESDIIVNGTVALASQKTEAERELAENKITRAEYNQRMKLIEEIKDKY